MKIVGKLGGEVYKQNIYVYTSNKSIRNNKLLKYNYLG